MHGNGDLMLLLAHLLSLNAEWRHADLRIRSIVFTKEEQKSMQEKLGAMLSESRIRAKSDVILNRQNEDVTEMMHRLSKDADIVFLGLGLSQLTFESAFAEKLDKMVRGFNATILVRNAESTEGELID